MPSKRLIWTLLPALLVLGPTATALERLSAEQLGRLLSAADASQARQRLATVDAAQLPKLMQEALRSAATQPALGEALLHQGLLRLREPAAPRDAASRVIVQSLLGYPAQTWVPPADPDHGRGQWTPAFDLAAAARGTLAIWQGQDAEQSARAALLARDYDALRRFDDAALARVLASAAPTTLRAVASRGPWPDATLAVLALRLADGALAAQLLTQARDAELLAHLDALAAGLPPAQAQVWLQQLVAQRPALASAALLAMGRRIPLQAQDYLLAQLGDPQLGGSSAQALAASATPAVRAALADILASSDDGPRLRRALLALHWMEDAASRAMLQAFAANPARPVSLRSEVTTWLR